MNGGGVPERGRPEAMPAVVSGSIQFNFSPVVNILPLSRDGKLLALAASTGKRSAVLPDLPTVAEAGVPGYVFDPWFGVLAPAKTPKVLLAKLSNEIARIVELSDVKERLRALGADPAPTTPEGFDAHGDRDAQSARAPRDRRRTICNGEASNGPPLIEPGYAALPLSPGPGCRQVRFRESRLSAVTPAVQLVEGLEAAREVGEQRELPTVLLSFTLLDN